MHLQIHAHDNMQTIYFYQKPIINFIKKRTSVVKIFLFTKFVIVLQLNAFVHCDAT